MSVEGGLIGWTLYAGSRFNFDEDIIVSGMATDVNEGGANITITAEVYNGSTQLATITADEAAKKAGMAVYFASPLTFPGGTDIDVVIKPATANTIGTYFTMGNSPPADVQSAAGPVTYVNGATPGSFTETANQYIPMALIVDNNPAIAGGGGGCIIGGR